MLSPSIKRGTGLRSFFDKWGVEYHDNRLVIGVTRDPLGRIKASRDFPVNDFPFHEITSKMKGSTAIFFVVNIIKPAARSNRHDLRVTTIARSMPEAWEETDYENPRMTFDKDVDIQGPHSIAIAVQKQGGAKNTQGRFVAIGDGYFLANQIVRNAPDANWDMLLNSIYWLTEHEDLISIDAKSLDLRPMTLSLVQLKVIFWLTQIGLPLIAIILGTGVWFVRRK